MQFALFSKTIKKNHWCQWWRSKPFIQWQWFNDKNHWKNHRYQWLNFEKTIDNNGSLVKKPLKNHWLRWYLAKKPLPFHRGQKLTIAMLYSVVWRCFWYNFQEYSVSEPVLQLLFCLGFYIFFTKNLIRGLSEFCHYHLLLTFISSRVQRSQKEKFPLEKS